MTGLIRRIAPRKIRPLRSGAQNPQDAIEHFTPITARPASTIAAPPRLRNQRPHHRPLCVREIQPRYPERGVVQYAGDLSSTGDAIVAFQTQFRVFEIGSRRSAARPADPPRAKRPSSNARTLPQVIRPLHGRVSCSALLGRRRTTTKPLALGASEPGSDTRDSQRAGLAASDLRVMFAQRREPCLRPQAAKPRWT